MKKLIIALLVLVVLASCGKQPEMTVVNFVADTTVRIPKWKIVTAPRYDCNRIRLKEDKLVSFDTSSTLLPITLRGIDTLYCDHLKHSANQSGGANFSWLWNSLKWIGAIILLLIALWILYQILLYVIEELTRRRNPTISRSPSTTTESTTPNQQRQADVAALTALVSAMGSGGGGTLNAFGISVEVYGVQAPLVHIDNSGDGASSGDVEVHVGDDNSDNSEKSEEK